MAERLLVRMLPGAGPFSSLFCPFSCESLNQVPHGYATLLIFLLKHKCLAVLLDAKQAS